MVRPVKLKSIGITNSGVSKYWTTWREWWRIGRAGWRRCWPLRRPHRWQRAWKIQNIFCKKIAAFFDRSLFDLYLFGRGRVADPGSDFFPSRIRIFPIPDPGSASKNLSTLTQKIVSKLSEIWSGLFIPDPDPGSGSWFFNHPGSRGQKGTGSRIRIRNTGRRASQSTFILLCYER